MLEQRLEEQLVIGVFRVGYRTVGSGEMKLTCEASGGASCQPDETWDYDDEATVAFNADLLFRTTSRLRLGIGSLLVLDPKYKLKFESGQTESVESGTEVSLFGVVEGIFPVADTVGISVRGNVGATALFAGEDHKRGIEDDRADCRQSSWDSCDTSEGPFFGPMFGLGVGVLIQTGAIGLRIDTLGEYVSYPLSVRKSAGSGATIEEKVTSKGSRGFLFLGIEL